MWMYIRTSRCMMVYVSIYSMQYACMDVCMHVYAGMHVCIQECLHVRIRSYKRIYDHAICSARPWLRSPRTASERRPWSHRGIGTARSAGPDLSSCAGHQHGRVAGDGASLHQLTTLHQRFVFFKVTGEMRTQAEEEENDEVLRNHGELECWWLNPMFYRLKAMPKLAKWVSMSVFKCVFRYVFAQPSKQPSQLVLAVTCGLGWRLSILKSN